VCLGRTKTVFFSLSFWRETQSNSGQTVAETDRKPLSQAKKTTSERKKSLKTL